MSEQYNHILIQPLSYNYVKKDRGGRPQYKFIKNRDRKEFLNEQIIELDYIERKFERDKKNNTNYDPNLIFKITTNYEVYDENFIKDLYRAGIDIISVAPNKSGYYIAISKENDFSKYRKKLKDSLEKTYPVFIDAIKGIHEIPNDDKIGEELKKKPLGNNELAYLDIEIWRMEDFKLNKFIKNKFGNTVNEEGGEIKDLLITEHFCLVRLHSTKLLCHRLLELREIAYIDRPPVIKIQTLLNKDIQSFKVDDNLPNNAPEMLIVDSGILRHPLLENAIGQEIPMESPDGKTIEHDDVGHGTQVSSIALYGDIQRCIENSLFKPEIKIHSAKVMFSDGDGQASYSEEKLLEHQLQDIVKNIVTTNPNCKIINMSLGNSAKKMFSGMRQFPLSILIDKLAYEYDLIFVISIGNNEDDINPTETYPKYLLEDSKRVKIIEPATAALALTVGSIAKRMSIGNKIFLNLPSPFTRVGPGYKDMIKPELVDDGGGIFEENYIITVNPSWLTDGRLFTLSYGTSFSTPKVSHYIAKLIQKYPSFSNNLIKALLISSTSIPDERPEEFKDAPINKLLNVYGYGIPYLNHTLYSEKNRVLLLYEGEISTKHYRVFEINLPNEFIEEKGKRSISVTITFNPPINHSKNYFDVAFEAYLFKNEYSKDVASSFKKIDPDLEESIPEILKKNLIKLQPGISLRKRGVHQKGLIEYNKKPKIDKKFPLSLVVVCKKVGNVADDYKQRYAIVVSITHKANIDLYNRIRAINQSRIQIRQ